MYTNPELNVGFVKKILREKSEIKQKMTNSYKENEHQEIKISEIKNQLKY